MPVRNAAEALLLLLTAAVAALSLRVAGTTRILAAPAVQPVLLVVNKSENTLAIVDPATFQVLARVPTGEGPHEVAASADGRLAFVTNYGPSGRPGHSLSVIDLAARQEIRRVELGELTRPHGVVVVGGKAYFTVETPGAVARLDPATLQVDWIAKTGQSTTHMLAATPDGKRLYATNIGSNTVNAIEIATGKVTQIRVGPQPEGLDLSRDGRELWVGQNGDGRVSIIDTASDQVKETVPGGRVPIRVGFTPDGKWALISDMSAGELVVLDTASRKEIKRIPLGPAPVGVLVAPDGKRAFVAATAANRVVVVDLEKFAAVGSFEVGAEPDGMAWVAGTP